MLVSRNLARELKILDVCCVVVRDERTRIVGSSVLIVERAAVLEFEEVVSNEGSKRGGKDDGRGYAGACTLEERRRL